MTDESFNEWWNADKLLLDNPFEEDTPAYWAWEGWCAAKGKSRNKELEMWHWGYDKGYENARKRYEGKSA